MKMTLTRRLAPVDEKQYIELPFVLPEETEQVSVLLEVESISGEEAAVIDLGIRDGVRVRGWSGGARSGFILGLEQATPGYLPGELAAGEWAILLGAYRIPAGGCLVTVELDITPLQERWVKGELHAHTTHSDGAFSLAQVERMALVAGLDFLALTDHNTISQNKAYPRESELVFLPAMEWTSNFGHCNLYGVEEPLDDFRAIKREDVERLLHTARERGARISLNHPHCRNCGWHWGFDVDYDWVEIWNGPWREDNEITLDWWQGQLAAGRRLVAVGGSDFHRIEPYRAHGWPTAWVWTKSRTREGIMRAIDQGHVSLSYAPDGPLLTLAAAGAGVGDTVLWSEEMTGLELSIRCTAVQPGDVIRLICENGMQQEWQVDAATEQPSFQQYAAHPSEQPLFTASVPFAKRLFYRLELRRYFAEVDAVLLAAASNPLYVRDAPPSILVYTGAISSES